MLVVADEERELRMAIELSLQDNTSPESGDASHESQTTSNEYSTIVTRVPNKSVEDVHREVNSELHKGEPGACGGNRCPPEPDALHMPNSFGLIKDLSVANILSSDKDKTKEFEKKDFSQIYKKDEGFEHLDVKKQYLTPGGMLRKEGWLEQTVPSGRGSPFHCPASNTPREPYTPLCSSSRHFQTDRLGESSYCTLGASRSPKDKCPLASPFSRSPRLDTCPLACGAGGRGPRDRRSYSGFESYTDYPQSGSAVSGRSTPDLLQIGVPSSSRRSTSWGDAREAAAASMTQSMTLPSHGTTHGGPRRPPSPQPTYPARYGMEEDDPGPRLDAVLRSLHKLTARLGDEDTDMFPSYDASGESANTSNNGNKKDDDDDAVFV